METALITFILIALFASVILVDDFIRYQRSHRHGMKSGSRMHVLEMGRECEELYIPGDINSQHDADIIEYDEEMI